MAALAFNQFLMLMYKGFLLRKRHYVVTAVEIIICLLVASPAAIICSHRYLSRQGYNVCWMRRDYNNATFYSPFSPFKSDVYWKKKIILVFAPNNSNCEMLINSAVDIAKKHHPDRQFSLLGFDTERELEQRATIIQSESYVEVIGTVLTNFPNDKLQLPKNLEYKIRYGDSDRFNLNKKYSYMSGPSYGSVYTHSYFLAWQAAIEQAFINMKSGRSDEDYMVMMNRFPYPPYNYLVHGSSFPELVNMCVAYGFIVFFILLVKRIVDEKANHSKELLKMMGMTDFVYWSSTFFNAFVFGAVIMLAITIMYTVPLSNNGKVFHNVDFGLVFIIFLLFLASSILFCFAVTTFFNHSVLAVCITLILYVVSHSVLHSFSFWSEPGNPSFHDLTVAQKLTICLLPTAAIQAAFKIIAVYEGPAGFDGWSSITKMNAIPDLSLSTVMFMMLLSCVVYAIIIWYVDAVWPWQFGVPKPFYFPFTKSYWYGPSFEISKSDLWKPKNEFVEKDPEDAAPGIVIRNLSKEFTSGFVSKKAVDNVSLNIYSGQITALLGRNGAGKTTTINILTGLFPPTSGSASIDGWDIHTHTNKARSSFGICPQHSILHDTLTVEEHLVLYAGLKGVPWGQIRHEVSNTLRLLKLEARRTDLAQSLPGGMRRRLSLGIAIIGGSKVLFLDEPTSGMDVEARRGLWDILLDIRMDRTIVLTTHYMEEADVLGDRIAIMADGKIQCCGSPLFLKRKFGTGYHIHIAKKVTYNLDSITLLLQKHIPQATLANSVESSTLTYSFGTETSGSVFGTMLRELESQKSELGISSFGITITTMDDVFLKISMLSSESFENAEFNDSENEDLIAPSAEGDGNFLFQHEKLAPGHRLWFSQMTSLFLKRLFYAKRHLVVMIFQAVLPFVIICFFMWVLKNHLFPSQPGTLSLDLSSVYGSTRGIYNFQGNANVLEDDYLTLLRSAGVRADKVDDPNTYALNMAIKSLNEFRKKLSVGGIGTSSNGILNVTAWYNGEPHHVLPISLSLMHEALLRHFTSDSSSQILLTNAPLPLLNSKFAARGTELFVPILSDVFMPLAMAFMTASYILVPIHECATQVKLLQLMTGISAFTYWLATFLWDMLIHTILSLLLIIPFGLFAGYAFFPHPEAIGSVILLFLLFGWSTLPICYLLSRVIKKPATGFTLIMIFTVIIGTVPSVILALIAHYIRPDNWLKMQTTLYFFRLLPSFAFSWGFSNLMSISLRNAFCDSIGDILDFQCKSPSILRDSSIVQCCKDICGNNCFKKTYPITWDKSGCGRDMFFLWLDGVIFFAFLFFWETGIPTKGWNILMSHLPWKKRIISFQVMDGINYTGVDSDVLQEESRIKGMSFESMKDEALVVRELTKWYKGLCAVDGLTFGVHQQECFGLLGVNGAGKTSTFKMLTGDIFPTKGNAFIQNVYLQTDLKQFQSFIGYCPQYNALIDRLTGREMLELFACLRGMPRNVVSSYVSKLIQNVDLQEHADKKTALYSGGNKRKLSLALALIGNPSVILLDEPSAGVDPVSRRKMWKLLDEMRKEMRCAVILCTHSMEECEALCSRLAIMVNGQFLCLGSVQHLKSKYGLGYTVVIKLKREQVTDSDVKQNIRTHFERTFPGANLKDNHHGFFHFHVTDTSISWSHLFLSMEDMKQTFQFEDYLISGTTLEQIFLAFARAQRITDNPN